MLASGGDDNSLKLWFWLIVGVIFLIKKAIELLKPDEKDEEPSVPDTENHHEKRVREVIAEMRRATPQPQQTQPAAPARAPRPSAPPVELPSPAVARKPQPIPGAGGCTTRGNSPADGAKCAGTLRKSYGRSPAIHALSFRCGTGGSATFAKEGDEGTSARPSSVISRSGISFPEKFPSPPQIPESGCSLSGNPWKTQSITKRILQR